MEFAMDGGQWAWLITTVVVAVGLIALHAHLDKVSRKEREEDDE